MSERLSPGAAVARWARDLHPDPSGRGGDRAVRARLRRAATPIAALADPATVELVGALLESGDARFRDRLAAVLRGGQDATGLLESIGMLAATLASAAPARELAPRFAEALGKPDPGGDRPRLSTLRFAQLLNAAAPEDRLRRLRRAVAQLDGRPFDLARFANDILFWGDAARIRWTFQYHLQSAATPRAVEEETPQ